MVLLYLSRREREHDLDEVAAEFGMSLHAFPGEYSLKQLVSAGYQYVTAFLEKATFLAIDVDCITDDDMDSTSYLQSIRFKCRARIVLLSQGLQARPVLISRAVEAGFCNVVTATDVQERWQELETCFGQLGMQQEDAERYVLDETAESSAKEAKDKTLRIGVCGLIHRCGTTTFALQLAAWLGRQGKTACVIEANDHGHLATVRKYYEVTETTDGGVCCDGVSYYEARIPSFRPSRSYDVLIYDYGMLEEVAIEQLARCDLPCVIAGAKPWEAYWLPLLFDQEKKLPALRFVFTFVPSEEQGGIRDMMGKHGSRTHFSAYAPGLFDDASNNRLFETLMKKRGKTGDAK